MNRTKWRSRAYEMARAGLYADLNNMALTKVVWRFYTRPRRPAPAPAETVQNSLFEWPVVQRPSLFRRILNAVRAFIRRYVW